MVHSVGRKDLELVKGDPSKEVTSAWRLEEVSKIVPCGGRRERRVLLSSGDTEGQHPFPIGKSVKCTSSVNTAHRPVHLV